MSSIFWEASLFYRGFFCRDSVIENLLYKVAYHPKAKPFIKNSDVSPLMHFVQTNVHMFAMEYRIQKDNRANSNDFLLNLLHGLVLLIYKEQLLKSGKLYDNQHPYQQHKLAEFVKLVNEHLKPIMVLTFMRKKWE